MKGLKKSPAGLISAVVLLALAVTGLFTLTNDRAFAMSNGGKPKLNIRNNESAQMPIALPGANGVISKQIANTGSHNGNLSVSFSEVINSPGKDGEADLGANTEIAAYIDVNADGNWDAGDIGLNANGSTYSCAAPLSYDVLNRYSCVRWSSVFEMNPSATVNLIVNWRIPVTAGNEIQGDSVTFNNIFMLEDQIR